MSRPTTRLTSASALRSLRELADPAKAAFYPRFFKTGPGQYGEGDRFLGVTVPLIRSVARDYRILPDAEVKTLLTSPWHEARLLALVIWVERFKKADSAERDRLHRAYLASVRDGQVNNWDLVDTSAPLLVGAQLTHTDDSRLLDRLAQSQNIWERRVAIVATLHLIRQGEFAEVMRISAALLADQHDLIHKAVGWMLREMGKRDELALREFLDEYGPQMPRTALRYAIERLPERDRLAYLKR